ncbi:MAG: hypothetical protein QM765_37310 [Myxococcales bacterium]
MPRLSTKELQERLAQLARTAPPEAPEPAAMCYEQAAPPTTADYVCPVDGSRTQYTRGQVALIRDLLSMRQAAKSLPGLDATLDERDLCRECSPEGQGSVALIVKYPDGKVVRTDGVSGVDLQLLEEFLSGKLTHADDFGGESPLKGSLPRLQALLGLDSPS